ncbi:MAG: hypothetical protein AAGA84_08855 [Pseudomonadota bacterium]
MSLFSELKRRNVIRMAVLYGVGSWLILQVADLLADALDVPDWTLRFILMILLLGFPLALIFSWVYEITPEGLKKESEVSPDQSVTNQTAKKLDVAVIGLLLAVLGVFAIDRLIPESAPNTTQTPPTADTSISETDAGGGSIAPSPDAKSVAVLPFADLSPNRDNDYFSDGLTDTLLHVLAQVPELKVAARTSSFAFKGKTVDVRDIAQSLAVANVLVGSVQRSGDRVRITAQLTRAEDGYQIWSQRFDKTVNDTFAIQDEIASAVSKALAVSLMGADGDTFRAISTSNIEAYDLYLQALSEYHKASIGALENAEGLLQRAIAIEPEFAEAQAQLAAVYMWLTSTGAKPSVEGMQLTNATARRALAIDPNNVNALVLELESRGRLATELGQFDNMDGSIEDLKALIERVPGEVSPRYSYSGYLTYKNRWDEALEQIDIALELDPLNPEMHYRRGQMLSNRNIRLFTDARLAFKRALELEPEQPNVYSSLGALDLEQRNLVGFVQNFEQAALLDPRDAEMVGEIARILMDLDLFEYALPYLERAKQISPDTPYVRMLQAQYYFQTGDYAALDPLARQMIAEDVDNRRDAFEWTVEMFLTAAQRQGTLDEAYRFVLSHHPSFESPLTLKAPAKVLVARARSSLALLDPTDPDSFEREAQLNRAILDAFGFDPKSMASAFMQIKILEQEPDAIIEFLRDEVFTERPFGFLNNGTLFLFDFEVFKPVLEHPDVAAGLAAWDVSRNRELRRLSRYFERRKADEAAAASDAEAETI